MPNIQLSAISGSMAATLHGAPVFPGDSFPIGFPEAIGDTSSPCWFTFLKASWQPAIDGNWKSEGRIAQLSYRLDVTPKSDFVDIVITLKNEGGDPWNQTMAFNCLKCGDSVALKDHECTRHWVRTGGQFKRLIELPRIFGPRPTVQIYNVENAPPGKDIPFAAAMKATTEGLTLEPWMAIASRDGKSLAAVVSKPALFLFQNMEYSCIHSAATFGPIQPGESRRALTRIYLVQSSLQDWHARMREEIDSISL